MSNSKTNDDPIDPNAFGDTIKAQDDTGTITPPNDEWYTLNLSRVSDEDSDPEGSDLIAADSGNDIGTEVTKSSSFYEGRVVSASDESDDVINTDLGGVTNEETNEDTVSAKVGIAGHPGDDSGG